MIDEDYYESIDYLPIQKPTHELICDMEFEHGNYNYWLNAGTKLKLHPCSHDPIVQNRKRFWYFASLTAEGRSGRLVRIHKNSLKEL